MPRPGLLWCGFARHGPQYAGVVAAAHIPAAGTPEGDNGTGEVREVRGRVRSATGRGDGQA